MVIYQKRLKPDQDRPLVKGTDLWCEYCVGQQSPQDALAKHHTPLGAKAYHTLTYLTQWDHR